MCWMEIEVSNMLYIVNFNIKEYKLTEFQKFVKANEKTLAKHAPKGWKYMGTYFYVLGFGHMLVRNSGNALTMPTLIPSANTRIRHG